MTVHPVQGALPVAFHVYSCSALPIPVAAERLRRVVPLPLSRYHGACRGEYYRWSGDDGADLLVQTNVLDEDGLPVEPGAPANAVLVYATGLTGDVHEALAGIDGLMLLEAEVVTVPSSANPSDPPPQRVVSL